MYKSEVLYSALIKKSRLINNNTTRLTLPKDAILLSGLNSDFFEVRAYSDRIELKSHNFKFVGGTKETSSEEKKVSEIRLEKETVETKSSEPTSESEPILEKRPEEFSEKNDNTDNLLDSLDVKESSEEKDDADRLLDSLDEEYMEKLNKLKF